MFPNFFFSATKIDYLGVASCLGHYETEQEADATCDFHNDYRAYKEFIYSYKHFLKCYFCGWKITAIQAEMDLTDENI